MIEDTPSQCGNVMIQTQRTELTDVTLEDPSQETTHSARNLSVSEPSQDSNGDWMKKIGLCAS